MNKQEIINALIAKIEDDLRQQLKAQEDAASGATHAESKAETKWDTCGLEASYLARGLAKQFEQLAAQLEELKAFSLPDYSRKPIGPGALIETEMNGFKNWFMLMNGGGGTELDVDGTEVTVITPESPLGAALIEKQAGDSYSFRAGSSGAILSVQ